MSAAFSGTSTDRKATMSRMNAEHDDDARSPRAAGPPGTPAASTPAAVSPADIGGHPGAGGCRRDDWSRSVVTRVAVCAACGDVFG